MKDGVNGKEKKGITTWNFSVYMEMDMETDEGTKLSIRVPTNYSMMLSVVLCFHQQMVDGTKYQRKQVLGNKQDQTSNLKQIYTDYLSLKQVKRRRRKARGVWTGRGQ